MEVLIAHGYTFKAVMGNDNTQSTGPYLNKVAVDVGKKSFLQG